MKQESAKKTPKWLLPVIIAAAVLVVAGIVLAIFLPTLGQEGETAPVQSKLYWNVDRLANIEEESGMSIREPGSDGLYAIRFAVGGEQVEYKCADKRLVNAIDIMSVMGLVFDDNGLIVDAVDPKTVATEVGREVYTKNFAGTLLEANSSMAMNGMVIRAQITENTGIWDVSPDAEVVGQAGTPGMLDIVSIYADASGEITDIFIVKRAKTAGVYYRLDQKYDSNLASTTREPDENGVYTILFAHEGEQVEMKCKDVNLVTNIDSLTDSKVQMGLVLDEEGYIVERISVAEALKGKLMLSMYDVTSVSGNLITAESKWSSAKDKGEIKEFEIPETCDDIFLMETECGADHAGERISGLQVGDRVYVYTDFNNNPLLIYVTLRGQDYPVYYNVSRKYDSEKNETTRELKDGWYVYEMIKEGGAEVTLKTKDKKLANRIDAFSNQLMGVLANGGIIENVCSPVCITGRTGLSGRYVTEAMGTIYRVVSGSDLSSGSNLVLSPDCKIYDLTSSYGKPRMSETTLQLYDRITLYRTPGNEIGLAIVTERYEDDTKIYENLTRKYSSKKLSTTRVPDDDGYYVFDMLCEGKQVQVKTKDVKLATYIDKVSNRFLALKVSGGIIKEAHSKFYMSLQYGTRVMSGVYFDHIDAEGKVHYYTISDGEKVYGSSSQTLASNCVVYNNSEAYEVSRGEKTKLKKGDQIYTVYTRDTKQVQQIFVRTREVNGPLYWHVKRQYNSTKEETTRQVAADGYYYIDLVADGQIKTFKTKSKDVASRVDSYSYAFGMAVSGDTILYPVSATYVKGIEKYLYRFTYVKEIKGNTVITETVDTTSDNYGKDLELKYTKNSKIYDVCTYSEGFGKATTLNIGDRVVSYVDEKENVVYSFVDYKCTREAGFRSVCEHCQKEVTWTPFVGTIATQDMHYYLPNDRSRSQREIGYTAAKLEADDTLKQFKTCFDLNGHTLTADSGSRNFMIYSELNLMDSAGGGKLISENGYTSMRLSFSGDAKLNIYGGTYEKVGGTGESTGALIYGGSCTVNIYDGTFIGGNATTGGIIHVGTNSLLNIEGGNFVSGTASTAGNSIYILSEAGKPSTLAMKNCKIDGGVAYKNDVKVILGEGLEIGNAKGTGIRVVAGQKLDISKMDTTTSVYVKAEGVFTTERDDIADLKDCFLPVDEYGQIDIDTEGKALTYELVVPLDPETDTQKRVEKWVAKVKADGAFAAGGQLPITCPICNGVGVTWEIASPGMTVAKTGGHYYFNSANGEIEYNAMNLLTTSYNGQKACIYLNDQNVSTQGRIRIRSGEYNIFGDGNITKADNDGSNKEMPLIDITTFDTSRTELNIYGGNYVSNVLPANVPAGVPALGISAKGAGTVVNIYGGTFSMADGTVGSTIRTAVGGDFNLYGGTVNSGAAGAINADTATVLIQDMTLQGVNLTGQSMLTLIGNVQIPADKGGLTLAEGAFADVSQLNAASSIVVSATGVFTTENEAAGAVKDCFLPADPEDTIVCDGYTLSYQAAGTTPPAPPVELPEITNTTFTTDWAPNADGYAYCEACYKQAIAAGATEQEAKEAAWQEWTPYDESLSNENGNLFAVDGHNGKHYYLTGHQTFAKKRFARVHNNLTVCLNLNGFNVTKGAESEAAPVFVLSQDPNGGTPVLNIMDSKGTSIVTGGGSDGNTNGCAISVDEYGVCNIYGGTFRRTAAGAVRRTVTVAGNGTLNLYNGTIDARLYDTTNVTVLAADQTTAKRAGMGIYMSGTAADAQAVVNMFGGTVIGGTLTSPFSTTGGGSAIVVGAYAQLNMADGTVCDGINTATARPNCGNISIAANGELNLAGGTIAGEVYAEEGAVLTLTGAPTITRPENGTGVTLADGVVFNVDGLAAQAQIAVEGEAGKVISNVSANAAAVKDCFNVAEELTVEVGATGALTIVEETDAPPAQSLVMTADPSTAADPLKAMDDNITIVKNWHETVGKTFDTIKDSDGDVSATCPFCSPDTNVVWKQYTTGATLTEGCHMYFAADVSYNNVNIIVAGSRLQSQCIYLNSKNFTGSAAMRIRARYGFNLIGFDSTITRAVECVKAEGFLAPLDLVSNFYGGTYINNDPDVALLRSHANAADVRLYDVVLTGNAGNVLDDAGSYSGKITFYGGTVTGNVAQTKDASILQIFSSQANPAVFTGSITYAEQSTLNLVGNPTIGGAGLTLPGAAVLNVDKLTADADITVVAAADKVLTNVSDNAEAVKDCFTVADGLKVELVDKTLVVKVDEPNPAQNVIDWVAANGAAFRAEGKLEADATVSAPCPFCSPDNNVTWTGISSNSTLTDGCHVYWINDWLKASTHNAIVGGSTTSSHCVYMNGFNAGGQKQDGSYYTAGNRIRARGGLNLIAYGSTITRPSNCTADPATYPSVIQAEGVAKIYGGTFVNADSNVPLLRITQNTTNVEIYDAVLQGTGNCVISNTADKAGTLSLYNCTVVSNDPAVKAISLTGGTLNLHSGTVTGGVELAESVVLNLIGSPVVDSGLPAAQQGIQSQEENSQSVKN